MVPNLENIFVRTLSFYRRGFFITGQSTAVDKWRPYDDALPNVLTQARGG